MIEHGPDSIFLKYPETLSLLSELGLDDDLVEPKTRQFSIFVNGRLEPVPPGATNLGAPDLDRVGFLSTEGKGRALSEKDVPPYNLDDESVGGFFERRFGAEYAGKILNPIFAGTHGGSAEALSIRALYPTFFERERRYGSLRAAAAAGTGSSPARFVSLKKGLGSLGTALRSKLQVTIVRTEEAASLQTSGDSVTLNGLEFDSVVLAVPAPSASRLLSTVPAVAADLDKIVGVSSSIVSLGYLAGDTRLEGSGFLVADGEELPIAGATFTSDKWDDRCPQGMQLVRAFFRWEDGSVEDAVETLDRLFGLGRKPVLTRRHVWEKRSSSISSRTL